ncbi:MAG: hypothetical protein NVSMB59_10150 [Vulcanimicrobiaceae bacterium]
MSLVAFVLTVLALVPSLSSPSSPSRGAPIEQRYFLIDGPEYRAVPRALFASYTQECRPRVVRRYADVRVVTHLCYL